jgi:hypothetical protein
MFNEAQPTHLQGVRRVVVIGDVHGDVQRWMQCMYAANLFNHNLEWIAEPKDTIVVQLGDQVDSASRGGPEGWEVVSDTEMIYLTDRLDKIARAHGGRVLSLVGNHELMNVMGDFSYVSATSASHLPLGMRRQMFQPGGSVSNLLSKRNVILKIGSKLFCHGGLLPFHLDAVDGNLHTLNEVTRKYLKGMPLSPEETTIFTEHVAGFQGILWSRTYVELAGAEPITLREAIQDVLQRTSTSRVFVGHNTVENVACIADGTICLADAALSRAYSTDRIQFFEIIDMDTPQEVMRVLQIKI